MITKEQLEKLAELSRISLTLEEQKSFHKHIASILDFVSQVQEVSSKSPDSSARGVWSLLKNKFRDDEHPHPGGMYSEDILKQAPQREGNYIKVKKIL